MVVSSHHARSEASQPRSCGVCRAVRHAAAVDQDRRAALAALDLDGLALDLLVGDGVLRLTGLAGDLHGGVGSLDRAPALA